MFFTRSFSQLSSSSSFSRAWAGVSLTTTGLELEVSASQHSTRARSCRVLLHLMLQVIGTRCTLQVSRWTSYSFPGMWWLWLKTQIFTSASRWLFRHLVRWTWRQYDNWTDTVRPNNNNMTHHKLGWNHSMVRVVWTANSHLTVKVGHSLGGVEWLAQNSVL